MSAPRAMNPLAASFPDSGFVFGGFGQEPVTEWRGIRVDQASGLDRGRLLACLGRDARLAPGIRPMHHAGLHQRQGHGAAAGVCFLLAKPGLAGAVGELAGIALAGNVVFLAVGALAGALRALHPYQPGCAVGASCVPATFTVTAMGPDCSDPSVSRYVKESVPKKSGAGT